MAAVLESENNGELDSCPETRRFTTESIFDGRTEILIVHKGKEYRLRITKNDKLILTK